MAPIVKGVGFLIISGILAWCMNNSVKKGSYCVSKRTVILLAGPLIFTETLLRILASLKGDRLMRNKILMDEYKFVGDSLRPSKFVILDTNFFAFCYLHISPTGQKIFADF